MIDQIMEDDWEGGRSGGNILDTNTPIPEAPKLNKGQQAAIEAIENWMETDSSYFLLSGDAGTGKTFCVQDLIDRVRGNIVFTAPTNKATKVLRNTLTSDDYKPVCRTIYSLLGLKLSPTGAVKKLKSPEDPVDLKKIALIVVDEGSMVNEILVKEIAKATKNFKLKILFMGDRNQLPPVGEKVSRIWETVENRAELTEVMRFDNQILGMAGRIKEQVNHPAPTVNIKEDNNGLEGIWNYKSKDFRDSIILAADAGKFSNRDLPCKAIAWRNVTVKGLNTLIRAQLFDNPQESQWFPEDRIILTAPAMDLKELQMAHTDDEGTVESVTLEKHPNRPEFLCYHLSVMLDENKRINLWVLHESAQQLFRQMQSQLAGEAKMNPRLWKDYWDFTDTFHKAQYGYAITTHRAQGSTYHTCYVVWNDILLNRNRNEAFRCLYVACTRPKKNLILGSV